MNTDEQSLILLLKSAVTGCSFSLPEGFDPEKTRALMKSHCVLSAGFLGAVNCGLSRDLPVMKQLQRDHCISVIVSDRQLEALDSLFQAFEQNSIRYMPLKGCNLKLLYPQPCLRSMGDADILISMDQYPSICKIMEQLGYENITETDHELVWKNAALNVELHKKLIPGSSEDFCRYYGDGWKMAQKQENCRYSMSEEDQFVYLFTHFAKHYRDGGIGCRPVLDLWICQRRYPGMDRTYIREELQKLGLLRFYDHICRVIDFWFRDGAGDEKTEQISSFILKNGIWGGQQTHLMSEGIHSVRAAGSVSAGKSRWIRGILFPSRSVLQKKYPVLRKYPAVLPFVWVWRGVDIALFHRNKINAELNRLNSLTDENMTAYQKSLEDVGLSLPSDS